MYSLLLLDMSLFVVLQFHYLHGLCVTALYLLSYHVGHSWIIFELWDFVVWIRQFLKFIVCFCNFVPCDCKVINELFFKISYFEKLLFVFWIRRLYYWKFFLCDIFIGILMGLIWRSLSTLPLRLLFSKK